MGVRKRHLPWPLRAKTLEAIFTEHNPKGKHGAAHLLSKEEMADLIAYLKSL